MRLFIAIQFNDELLDALSDLQDDLKVMGVRGNFSKRENLHITLAFIGEYGNPDAVLDAMEQVEFRPFEISLEGVGSFGEIFWAGIAENKGLEAYVKRLRRELAAEGIPFDKKRFSPHITLIRKCMYKNGREIPVEKLPSVSMTATRVSLMRSERGKSGMIYTEIGAVEV